MEEVYSTLNKEEAAKIFTLNDIMESYYKFREQNVDMPVGLEFSTELYERMKELTVPDDTEPEKAKKMKLKSFYGMKIKIDPELKPGEWKLVGESREPLYLLTQKDSNNHDKL